MKRNQLLTMLLMTAPIFLSACDGDYMYEVITGDRPDQVVDGPRRSPAMNKKNAKANTKPAPMVTNVQPSNAPSMNPYDNFDARGNQVAQTQPAAETVHNNSNFFTRTWDDMFSNSAAAPDANARKPLPGNPYVSPETSPVAPLPAAPLSARPEGQSNTEKKLSYPKLSSVPPTPPQFNEIKNTHEKNLAELETNHAVAKQDQVYLEREAKAEMTPPPAEPVKPLTPPPPPLKLPPTKAKTPAVSSLPAVNISAPPAPAAPAHVVAPAPIKPVAPLPATMVNDVPPPAAYEPAPYVAPNAAQNAAVDYAPLPSPDIIKTMKPSRYQSGHRD